METERPQSFMDLALAEAELAAAAGEVPVGAVVVAPGGRILAQAHNRVERDRDATAHAEILAIRGASSVLGTRYLTDCALYVTLEPCPMCAQAASLARIGRILYGAADPKGGGVDHGARIFEASSCHHKPDVFGGLGERAASQLLRAFFARLR